MSRAKILLADDVKSIVEMEKSYLSGYDLDVFTAYNGMEALKLIKAQKPNVVFLDLIMPELNGDVVCKAIKAAAGFDDCSIVIVTSRDDDKTLQRCFQCGCDAYVVKPITKAEFLDKLTVILNDQGISLLDDENGVEGDEENDAD